MLGLVVGEVDDDGGVGLGDFGAGDELEVLVDLVDPFPLVAADEALAEVVGDAAAGDVVVEGEGVEVGGKLTEELVKGGRKVVAGDVVGVDPEGPGFAGQVEGPLAGGTEVVDVRPLVARGVGVDVVACAVLLADLGDLDALGLGAGGVDDAHLADGRGELGERAVESLRLVPHDDAKRDLLARADNLHLGRWRFVNKAKPPAVAGGLLLRLRLGRISP